MTIKKVSIPYGKGKVFQLYKPFNKSFVSIPYGKGKDNIRLGEWGEYLVSIPYGKGKEQHFVLCFQYKP